MTKSYVASAVNNLEEDEYGHVILTVNESSDDSNTSIKLLLTSLPRDKSEIPEDLLSKYTYECDYLQCPDMYDPFSETYYCYSEGEIPDLDSDSKEVVYNLLGLRGKHVYKVASEDRDQPGMPYVEVNLTCKYDSNESYINRMVNGVDVLLDIELPYNGYVSFFSEEEYPSYIAGNDLEKSAMLVLQDLSVYQSNLMI